MNISTKLGLFSCLLGFVVVACDGAKGRPRVTSVHDDAGVPSAENEDGEAPVSSVGLGADAGVVGSGVAGDPCVFSADCTAGVHCDLGECAADCTASLPCAGGKTCSSRGRCLGTGESDDDPPPVTTRTGTVHADPASAALTDDDTSLVIHLTTDSKDTVRYRVELDAPYLSIDQDRGQFQYETTLALKVDGSSHSGQDVAGSVHIFTTLGDVLVEAPMKVGLTGTYQGVMSYDGSGSTGTPSAPLGTSQLVLDVFEHNGAMTVQADPARSLLFPAIGGNAATGRGSFTLTDGAQFSLEQVLPANFGGDDNPFRRSIGREVRFSVKPGANGLLAGTFEETIYGLFAAPTTLTGSVTFEHRTLDPEPSLDFAVPPAPKMPTVDATVVPDVSSVFPSFSGDAWELEAIAAAGGCSDTLSCANAMDQHFYQPLVGALSGTSTVTSPDPIGDIASECQTELAAMAIIDPVKCAQIAPIASTLATVQKEHLGSEADDAFATAFAHTLDPALLVADDGVVRAIKGSFTDGFQSELGALATARAVLTPSLVWVLTPSFLERLKGTPTTPTAAGDAPPSVVAARSLARTFYSLSTLDGEIARIAATDRNGTEADRLVAAQTKGVIVELEAATLGGLLAAWPAAPPDLGAEFTDVLTPMDDGFKALQDGALTYGVANGYVPFLYAPGGKATNFEQVMDALTPFLDRASNDEMAFVSASRTYEQNEDAFKTELEGVQSNDDDRLHELCGDDFDLNQVDWSTCGANSEGDVGRRMSDAELANLRVVAAEQRMEGMGQKIQIEWDKLQQVKEVREGTIRFTEDTGAQLDTVEWSEAAINATEKFLDVAANASVFNGGAPLGEAAISAEFELAKGGLEVQRQDLQNAQDVEVQAANSQVEVIDEMATIKGLMVDMAELKVETQEEVIGVLQADIDVRNSLSDARHLFADRTSTLARIDDSPLRDPSYRLLEDRDALAAMRSRADLQKWLYLAGRALEYQLNQDFDDALGEAVLNVFDVQEANRLKDCLSATFSEASLALGSTNAYTTEMSVRKLLGIGGSITDGVTGEQLSEADQFRRLLLENQNLDGNGGVGIQFSSSLDPNNGLWPSTRCDDRITTVEAELVGDFLGDNDAEVDLTLDGGGVLRGCDGERLVNWSTSGNASIQAGVNSYGTAPAPNDSLHGLSVASAKWTVSIPGPSAAPSNADVDLSKLDDVVIRVHHEARPIRTTTSAVSVACLADVGAGH
ncbi:MAG TPA: hypothetical protein VH142_17495 [Polyangiaceae bacterium]|nr:hypothetical protein [Polyangiaceae bacterium]